MADKIKVELIGTDGNAFALLGKVSKVLRKADMVEEAEKYMDEATKGDYNHLLRVTMKYVDIT